MYFLFATKVTQGARFHGRKRVTNGYSSPEKGVTFGYKRQQVLKIA